MLEAELPDDVGCGDGRKRRVALRLRNNNGVHPRQAKGLQFTKREGGDSVKMLAGEASVRDDIETPGRNRSLPVVDEGKRGAGGVAIGFAVDEAPKLIVLPGTRQKICGRLLHAREIVALHEATVRPETVVEGDDHEARE